MVVVLMHAVVATVSFVTLTSKPNRQLDHLLFQTWTVP
jgi:hypothetical protein